MKQIYACLMIVATIQIAGCKLTDQITAGVSAAVTAAITHTEVSVSVDPVTGDIVATINFKDANGNIVRTEIANASVLKQQCIECNDKAREGLKASYKRAIREIEATQKRELQRLKDERKRCGTVQGNGSVIQETHETFLNGETLPESGTFKAIEPNCKNGKCK